MNRAPGTPGRRFHAQSNPIQPRGLDRKGPESLIRLPLRWLDSRGLHGSGVSGQQYMLVSLWAYRGAASGDRADATVDAEKKEKEKKEKKRRDADVWIHNMPGRARRQGQGRRGRRERAYPVPVKPPCAEDSCHEPVGAVLSTSIAARQSCVCQI